MKQTLIIFGFLLATITTFAQSPRIKLNQITKDTLSGSVLISSATDSGMVYSRNFFISYGADTVLILYGDTLAATSGIISSVLSDGLTINGDGTTGNELEVDTSFIATLTALSDSLATVSASTTPDGVTITGVGTVVDPLKVDTLLIATIKALNDTLTNRGYLLESQLTDTLDANTRGYLTAEVDGSISNEGSLTVGAGTASTSVISSNTSGSTDVTLTAGTNVTLSESGNNITIAATGGGTSFNNISETADTVFISGDLNVDANTLYVDATTNNVGIGTSTPSATLDVVSGTGKLAFDGTRLLLYDAATLINGYNIFIGEQSGNGSADDLNVAIGYQTGKNLTSTARANLFLGAYTGALNTISGTFNAGVGYNSLYRLTSGDGNLAIGSGALDFVTTGSDNIGIGFIAGRNLTTGSDNIYIGGSALPNSATVTNEIVIGSNRTGRGSNTISLGNTSITSIAGQVSFSTYSDFRDKKNISDLNDGLNLLMRLRPVKFVWNTRDGGKVDVNDIGFIAQEVDGVQYQGIDSDYINIVTYNEFSDDWTITYDKFIPIITKAIQEQQTIIETQEQKITDLETTIQSLITRIENLENK